MWFRKVESLGFRNVVKSAGFLCLFLFRLPREEKKFPPRNHTIFSPVIPYPSALDRLSSSKRAEAACCHARSTIFAFIAETACRVSDCSLDAANIALGNPVDLRRIPVRRGKSHDVHQTVILRAPLGVFLLEEFHCWFSLFLTATAQRLMNMACDDAKHHVGS